MTLKTDTINSIRCILGGEHISVGEKFQKSLKLIKNFEGVMPQE